MSFNVEAPEPGRYSGVDIDTYHSAAGISSTGLHTVLSKSPAHYRWKRDNPERHDYFDLGNAVHVACLEPDQYEERVAVVEAYDWRTKAAKEERNRIRELHPHRYVLHLGHVDQVEGMVASLRDSADAYGLEIDPWKLLKSGEVEQTFVAKDPETGLMRRARPDCVVLSQKILVDLKTSHDASPRGFSKKRRDMGYDLSAAFHLDTTCMALGESPSDWLYLWVVVEKDPPYAVGLFSASAELLRLGRQKARQALGIVETCQRTGLWIPYSTHIEQLSLARFERELLPRETA